jgi:integrase
MATISKYQTASGATLYRVRYRTPDHRQTDKRGFTTKRDAEAFAATVEVSKLRGDYIAPKLGRVTVADLATVWMGRQVHTKPSWQTRQESIWRVHVEPKWGAYAVASITRPEVRDWIAQMDRAPSTIADVHGVLVAILDAAVEERRIPANPARGIKLPRRTPTEHDYLTHAQVAALAAESKHPEVVMLLAYSGLRWGEMAALRTRDIDLDRGRIRVNRSASKVNSRSVIGTPKTWERRTVAIPLEVAAGLRDMVAAAATDDALVWQRGDGTPIRPPTSTHWFGGAVQRASIADETFPAGLTAHELRHTAASLMIASGAHVKTVQRQLGHKSAVMTLDLYGHLFPDDLDDVATRMSEGLRAAKNGASPTAGAAQSPQSTMMCGQDVGTDPEQGAA